MDGKLAELGEECNGYCYVISKHFEGHSTPGVCSVSLLDLRSFNVPHLLGHNFKPIFFVKKNWGNTNCCHPRRI